MEANAPVTYEEVQRETCKDSELSTLKLYVHQEWPKYANISTSMRPYYKHRGEYSIEGECVLWQGRVVMPLKLRERYLQVLHSQHQGVTSSQKLAKRYAWWPGMNRQIESEVQRCEDCQRHSHMPPQVAIQPNPWPEKPWSRVHMDFAGPVDANFC